MRDGRTILNLRRTMDRAVLRAVSRLTTRSRDRLSAEMPSVGLRAEHTAGARLVPDRATLIGLFPEKGVGAEFGVDQGDFSALLLDRARPEKLLLVDPWSMKRYGEPKMRSVVARFAQEISNGRVIIERSTSVDAIGRLADCSLDWAYIDTDHTYRTTANELRSLERTIKPSGVIAGHDYVTGNWSSGYRYGVVEAVNEFCVDRNWRFVAVTHETDRHLSFALQRIPNDPD